MRRLPQIADIARSQAGLIRRAQIRDLGVSSDTMLRMTGQRVLQRLTPQVFLVGAEEPTWRQQATAAVWQAGAGAVLSHGAAARWWELPGYDAAPVEVTVGPRRRIPRSTIGTVHRSRRLRAEEVTRRHQLAVTGVARTIVDVGRRLDRDGVAELLQHASRRRLLRLPADMSQFFLAGRHGVGHIRAALDDAVGRPELESWLEERFLDLLRAHGFPPATTQRRVRVGQRDFRLDFTWEPLRLVAEVEGYATHSTRAQHTADANRRNLLLTAGYRMLVFTTDHVTHHQETVVAQLREMLG